MDFPGITCDSCEDMAEQDGELPECLDGDCPIPQLEGDSERLAEMYAMLNRLNKLVDSKVILDMYAANFDDLLSIAEIEGRVQEMREIING